MLILGDSDRWNPDHGQTGMRTLSPTLFAEFRRLGYIRHREDGSGLCWYFETRQIRDFVFSTAGLRYADESAGDFMRESKRQRDDQATAGWKATREKIVKGGMDYRLALLRAKGRRDDVKRALVAHRRLGA